MGFSEFSEFIMIICVWICVVELILTVLILSLSEFPLKSY